MKTVARKCALEILEAGSRKRNWTPEQRKHWQAAFNALQRLAGKKIVFVGDKLKSAA